MEDKSFTCKKKIVLKLFVVFHVQVEAFKLKN